MHANPCKHLSMEQLFPPCPLQKRCTKPTHGHVSSLWQQLSLHGTQGFGFLKRATCSHTELFGALTFWDASHLPCPHHQSSLGVAPPAQHKSGTEVLSQETNCHADSRVQGCSSSLGRELTTQLQLIRCTASQCIGATSTQV